MAKVYKSRWSDVKIPNVSLGEFFLDRLSKIPPETIALVDGNTHEKWTYQQFSRDIQLLGKHFLDLGIKKKSVVGILALNHPYYATVFHALAYIGAVVTTANPAYTVYELTNQFRDAGVSFIVTDESVLDRAFQTKEKLREHGQTVHKILTLEPVKSDVHKNIISVRELLKMPSKMKKMPKIQIDPKNDTVVVPYSSGTTGLPKGVMLTHSNMVSNILQTEWMEKAAVGDFTVSFLPFFHVYGLSVIINTCLCKGTSLVVMNKFDFVQYLTLASKYKAKFLHVVPPVMIAMAKFPIDKFDLSNVEMINSGAAPLGRELQEELSKKLPKAVVKQGYGMSELSPVSHSCHIDLPIPFGSIGQLLPNMEAKIVDDNGKMVPTGQTGELLVRGPNVMKGYLNNKKATDATIDKEGWLRTGDIAMADNEENFYIMDRLKELIKYKGFQVPPAELEALLVTHPCVADAAVIPMFCPEAGEIPRACIALKPNMKVTEDEIKKYVEERAAPHKKLRGGVRFIDAVPRSAAGKILRRVLVEEEKALKAKL